jgi:hypothetical protein
VVRARIARCARRERRSVQCERPRARASAAGSVTAGTWGANSPSRFEAINAASAVTGSGGLFSLTEPESFLRQAEGTYRETLFSAKPPSSDPTRFPGGDHFAPERFPLPWATYAHRRYCLNVLVFHRIALVLTKAPPSPSECRDSRQDPLTLTMRQWISSRPSRGSRLRERVPVRWRIDRPWNRMLHRNSVRIVYLSHYQHSGQPNRV